MLGMLRLALYKSNGVQQVLIGEGGGVSRDVMQVRKDHTSADN